jgi:DNA-binding response OmpR family regulator
LSKTVLIVDDERLLVRTLAKALREAGFRTLTASTAEQAEKHLGPGSEADLVVLDNRLPKKSGLEVLRYIREQGLPCRVVLMTAFDSADVKRQAEQLGVDKYFLKPFDLPIMVSAIEQLLGAQGESLQ